MWDPELPLKETERKGTGKRAHLVGNFRFCKVWRSVDQVNLCDTLNCTLTNLLQVIDQSIQQPATSNRSIHC